MGYQQWILSILTVCILFPTALRAQTDSTLTYEEAVNIALRENLQIQQQKNVLNTAEAVRNQAYARFLPEMGAFANGQRQTGRVLDENTFRIVDATSNFLSVGLNASLPLFSGLRNVNQLRQSRSLAEAQFYQINATKQQVVFDVSQQYLQVLLNQELLRIARANLEQQEELLESVTTFVEVGTQNIADQYNQEAETKRVALTVVEAENQLAISKAQLTRTLQIDPFREWSFTEPDVKELELLAENINLETVYNEAIRYRPDLQQQKKLVDANRFGVRVAQADFYPTIDVGYFYGSRFSSNDTLTLDQQITETNITYGPSVSLFIPIFQNLRTRTQVQRQRQVLENARLDLEDLERNILEQLQTATADYRAAQQRIVAATAQVKAAEKALEAEKERFRLGVGNILDLNRVNAAAVEAQANQVQANYTLIFQKTALEYFTGKLTPEQF
jgi:outer membrane protein